MLRGFWKNLHFFPRSPLSPYQAEEHSKSEQPLNYDHLNTCDDKTSLFNGNGTNLCTKWSRALWRCFPIIFSSVFQGISSFKKILFKKLLFGSPFVLAKVPIRSPSHSKLGPHFDQNGTWEQWYRSLHYGFQENELSRQLWGLFL